MDAANPIQIADRSCEREPVHLSGAIQPHGYLVVCSMPGWFIDHVSVNLAQALGMEPEAMIGQSLDGLLPEDLMHALGNAATTVMMESGGQQHIAQADLGPLGGRCDFCLYRTGGRLYIEIEPNERDALQGQQPLALAQGMINRLAGTADMEEFFDRAVQQMRSMTGFDRVMIYRFMHDGSGEVIAEARRSGMEAYLGLHYPASDIPAPARELYRRNRLRCIEDAGYTPVPIHPGVDRQGRPLNLGDTALRSVAPVHLEYLRNMGVGASMSVSVLVNGALWGLIACHHRVPRRVPMEIRSAADLFGMFFSMQVSVREGNRDRDFEARARLRHEELITELAGAENATDALVDRLGDLRRLVPCDGAGLWLDGAFHRDGAAPPATAMPALLAMLAEKSGREVFATHHLGAEVDGAEEYARDCSGLLALPISSRPGDYLMLFRSEHKQTITWAGDPNRPYRTDAGTGKISPRSSFAAWQQTVRGQSEPWSAVEQRVAERLRVALLEHVLRGAESDHDEQRIGGQRQRLVIAELNHRVKNLLALMQSLVMSSHDSADDLQEFVENLEGRIRALAFAHDQITPRSDHEASLRALVDSELSPYAQAGRMIDVDGPRVMLDNRSGPALALVLHEMTTNAVKYGALSVPGGRLGVTWSIDDAGRCVIEWVESEGPTVKPPGQAGFGSTLIQRSIPFELQGEATIDYAPEGLRARFALPGEHFKLDTRTGIEVDAPAPQATPLGSNLTVLLVEDNMLIALDTEHVLQRIGAAQVEVAGSVEEALEILQHVKVDAAVLDVNLGRQTSLPVADALRERGVPFVFATGYHDRAMIPDSHETVLVLRKPYTPDGLTRSLSAAIGTAP